MPERSTVSQQIQVGVESTYGTSVAANKLLTALGFDPSPQTNFTQFAPTGFKYDSIVALLQEWTQFSLSGYPTYTEIVYPLSSVLVAATPTTTTGVTTWIFAPATGAPDTVKSFTIERGSSVAAEKFTGGIISEFGINFSPTNSNLSGSGIGKSITTGITMTASPTSVALVPVLPIQVDVYYDSTQGALGTTKLTRVMSAAWKITNRQGPLWVLNSANSSFVAVVELKPTMTIELSVEADTAGLGPLADARAGTKKWIRIKATGGNIPASTPTTPYSITIDAPVQVNSISNMGDQDGVYKIDYVFDLLHDTTFGKAVSVTVVNDITAL